MLLASCPLPLFDIASSHLSPVVGIRVLSLPTLCMLPNLFRMFLPQNGHAYADFQSLRTILFSHLSASFLGLGTGME